ncbi:MAG: hypothetical protein M5U34_09500 [Chloroflexi bacterium]|nr:hypothetical protein [Chloroflexota bacterium]
MTLSFHIRHEVTFDRTKDVFFALAREDTYEHILQNDRQLSRLRQLGLLNDESLTDFGESVFNICQRKPNLWGDLLHFCHYTLWQSQNSSENGFSWTYRAFVDYIWVVNNVQINVETLEPIVSTLINNIETEPHF